jgi:uncharacterized beta-barrel protein YwiB (DUF1934 family)
MSIERSAQIRVTIYSRVGINGDETAESVAVTTTGQFVRTRTNSYIGRIPDERGIEGRVIKYITTSGLVNGLPLRRR